jgi:hypothetical protein
LRSLRAFASYRYTATCRFQRAVGELGVRDMKAVFSYFTIFSILFACNLQAEPEIDAKKNSLMFKLVYSFTPEQLKICNFPRNTFPKIDNIRYDLSPWLTDNGMKLPAGSLSIFNQKDSSATFVSTYDNLQLIITLLSPVMKPPKYENP